MMCDIEWYVNVNSCVVLLCNFHTQLHNRFFMLHKCSVLHELCHIVMEMILNSV